MHYQKDFNILSSLFRKIYNIEPATVVALAGAGSSRRYYRLSSPEAGVSCIGVGGVSAKENDTFIALSGIFRSHGINVPEVLAKDSSSLYYLQQDLGDRSLFSVLGERKSAIYIKESLSALVDIQTVPEKEWEGVVFNTPFSRRQVMWDLNYFKYEFLKLTDTDFDENELENEFERMADSLSCYDEDTWGFMYRDCQSRNVMLSDNEIWWIDFQGGRKGPAIYDVVSFLWQAKACFPKEFREEMLGYFADLYFEKKGTPQHRILDKAMEFALFRTLQVLGAYGLRGLVERKAHFIESIPYALDNVRELLESGVTDPYPELKRVLESLADSERFKRHSHEGLKVKVFSFSYKKGYPEDYSGNGGGFMFDCRAMHNPGRYEEYRKLTGLDREVVEFLEKRGEVQEFVRKALDIVIPSVDRYIKRGFTDLQIGFGCTGGQHRSVYCAESLSEKLSELFPEVEIEVVHRERGIIKRRRGNRLEEISC